MFPDEIVKIKRELKKRNLENLYCDYLTLRKYDEVIKILDLPQWNKLDDKGNYIYRHLLTSSIWSSNYEDIKNILELEKWNELDEKGNYIYLHLLTSSIWSINYKDIKRILELEKWNKLDDKGNYIYRHLLTSNIWHSNYEDIKNILELEKWNELDDKGNYIYRHLLTSSIWNSNFKDIQEKLMLPYWQNPIYRQLLTPTIWTFSNKKIQIVIETMEEYGLEKFITTSLLRKSKIQIIALINYLNKNQIPLIINEKLNPIFNVAPSVLKKKYNIDLKKLVQKEQLKGTQVL